MQHSITSVLCLSVSVCFSLSPSLSLPVLSSLSAFLLSPFLLQNTSSPIADTRRRFYQTLCWKSQTVEPIDSHTPRPAFHFTSSRFHIDAVDVKDSSILTSTSKFNMTSNCVYQKMVQTILSRCQEKLSSTSGKADVVINVKTPFILLRAFALSSLSSTNCFHTKLVSVTHQFWHCRMNSSLNICSKVCIAMASWDGCSRPNKQTSWSGNSPTKIALEFYSNWKIRINNCFPLPHTQTHSTPQISPVLLHSWCRVWQIFSCQVESGSLLSPVEAATCFGAGDGLQFIHQVLLLLLVYCSINQINGCDVWNNWIVNRFTVLFSSVWELRGPEL